MCSLASKRHKQYVLPKVVGIFERLHVHEEHQPIFNSVFRPSSTLIFGRKVLSFITKVKVKLREASACKKWMDGKWPYCIGEGPSQCRWQGQAWRAPPVPVLGRFDSSSQSLSDIIQNLFISRICIESVRTCVCDVAGVAVSVHPVPFCMDHQIRAVLRLRLIKALWQSLSVCSVSYVPMELGIKRSLQRKH